ncbi:MAG: hypothetical protein JSW08_03575 [archaeon]|nr:MAG: hypothetical protein JSW08_03575 [archaeon]
MPKPKHQRLKPLALGLGFVVAALIFTIFLAFFPGGLVWITKFYAGFIPGTTNFLAVIFWIIDCFIFGLLVAVFYNLFVKK